MTDEWDEPDATGDENGDEAGFVGGGGPAATIFGTDDEADEHGDALARPEDE